MDGWMDGKAGLRIAYSNQKTRPNCLMDKIILGMKTLFILRMFGTQTRRQFTL